jgi:hypothetical protein
VITAYKNKEWGFKYLSVLDPRKKKESGAKKEKRRWGFDWGFNQSFKPQVQNRNRLVLRGLGNWRLPAYYVYLLFSFA